MEHALFGVVKLIKVFHDNASEAAFMMNFIALLTVNILSDARISQATSSVQTDPDIDHNGQLIVRIGFVLLASGIIAIVGFFSRRVEYALIIALVFSLGVVAFFAFVK